MPTVIAAIIADPSSATALVHDVLGYLPAITTGLRAVTAAINLVAAVRAVRRKREDPSR